jgi:hypothetical protein
MSSLLQTITAIARILASSEIPLNRVGLRAKYAEQMLPDH